MYWKQNAEVPPQEEAETTASATSAEAGTSTENEEQQPQTLYVAIQPGANMDSPQVEQPAVYVEVVEAGNGTEIGNNEEQVVQEGMVIEQSK